MNSPITGQPSLRLQLSLQGTLGFLLDGCPDLVLRGQVGGVVLDGATPCEAWRPRVRLGAFVLPSLLTLSVVLVGVDVAVVVVVVVAVVVVFGVAGVVLVAVEELVLVSKRFNLIQFLKFISQEM